MGRSEGARVRRLEAKKETVVLLRAWAVRNIQRDLSKDPPRRGISAKTKGVDLSWVRCRGGRKVIESFRFDKFLDRLIPDGECVVFSGGIGKRGYGHIQGAHGEKTLAHRLSYQIYVGPLVPGLVIDHTCRNRACVRPDHLRQVTHQENILAGVGATALNAKKTHCKNGHEFTHENIYWGRHGRHCYACRKIQKKAWDLKNRERTKALRIEKSDKAN